MLELLDDAVKFLSTPSARRATRLRLVLPLRFLYFYPRPLRGGRRRGRRRKNTQSQISIHALCEEGDSISMSFAKAFLHFYPRPLRGGRPDRYDASDDTRQFLSTPSARRATART